MENVKPGRRQWVLTPWGTWVENGVAHDVAACPVFAKHALRSTQQRVDHALLTLAGARRGRVGSLRAFSRADALALLDGSAARAVLDPNDPGVRAIAWINAR